MSFVGPEVAVAGKLDLSACHSFEQERGVTGFFEAVGGDEHTVIVVERPHAGIEHPVRVLGKREAVPRMVVAAVGELVDVGGVHDAAGVDGDAPVAGQDAAELFAERGIVQVGKEVGIEFYQRRAASFGHGLSGVVERRPAAVAREAAHADQEAPATERSETCATKSLPSTSKRKSIQKFMLIPMRL